MSSTARYIQRAPRYVLRPEDQSLMRFAEMDTRGQAVRARVRDLSATGLSIIVESHETPMTGEMLKVEFSLPGDRQVAWFATVVRIERKTEWNPELGEREFTLVGLRFRQLPAPFTAAIRRSLEPRIDGDAVDSLLTLKGGVELAYQRIWMWTPVLIFAFIVMSLPPAIWLAPFHSLINVP